MSNIKKKKTGQYTSIRYHNSSISSGLLPLTKYCRTTHPVYPLLPVHCLLDGQSSFRSQEPEASISIWLLLSWHKNK